MVLTNREASLLFYMLRTRQHSALSFLAFNLYCSLYMGRRRAEQEMEHRGEYWISQHRRKAHQSRMWRSKHPRAPDHPPISVYCFTALNLYQTKPNSRWDHLMGWTWARKRLKSAIKHEGSLSSTTEDLYCYINARDMFFVALNESNPEPSWLVKSSTIVVWTRFLIVRKGIPLLWSRSFVFGHEMSEMTALSRDAELCISGSLLSNTDLEFFWMNTASLCEHAILYSVLCKVICRWTGKCWIVVDEQLWKGHFGNLNLGKSQI